MMKRARLSLLLMFAVAFVVTIAVGTPTVAAETANEQTPGTPVCNEWTGAPDIYVSPTYVEDNTLFALGGRPVDSGFSSGFLKSTDRGLTWREMRLDPLIGFISDLAFSLTYAEDHTLCFAAGTIYGDASAVFCSRDAGETWTSLAAPKVGGFRTLAIADSHTFFLGLGGGPPFQIPNQGLYRSDDGGQTWHFVFDAKGVYSVAVSPQFAEDHLVLITPGEYHGNYGVWRSEDGGATWQASYDGLLMWGDATDRIGFSPNYARDRTVFALDNWSSVGGLFKSTDQGRHWSPILTADKNRDIESVEHYIISPRYGRDLTLWARGSAGNGISTDGGATWRILADEPEPLAAAPYCLTDDRCGVELFAGNFGLDIPDYVYRSFDGGQTWQCLEDPALPPPPRAWLPVVAGPQTGN